VAFNISEPATMPHLPFTPIHSINIYSYIITNKSEEFLAKVGVFKI
jgi:hypothetical protein